MIIFTNFSNQIFHSNLIRSLGQKNEVTVFSSRVDSTQENPSLKNGNILAINDISILNGNVLIKSNIAANIVPINVHLKTILLSF